jgi:hypothetical protein
MEQALNIHIATALSQQSGGCIVLKSKYGII